MAMKIWFAGIIGLAAVIAGGGFGAGLLTAWIVFGILLLPGELQASRMQRQATRGHPPE
jgi:uncharacterized membrane protein YciS (DUF1049 family)